MHPLNPVISPKNYKGKGFTVKQKYNSNITQTTLVENRPSAPFLFVYRRIIHMTTSTPLYLWITIKYRKCSIPMHLGDGLSPTQTAYKNKAGDSFQCNCSKQCVCEQSSCIQYWQLQQQHCHLAHVHYCGTAQSKKRNKHYQNRSRCFTHNRSINIGSQWQEIFFVVFNHQRKKITHSLNFFKQSVIGINVKFHQSVLF